MYSSPVPYALGLLLAAKYLETVHKRLQFSHQDPDPNLIKSLKVFESKVSVWSAMEILEIQS